MPDKLAYVLPKYDEGVAEHFRHTERFLRALAQDGVDIYLFIERGSAAEKGNFSAVHKQKFLFLPLRMLEIFLVLLSWRLKGVGSFYVHYSPWGAISSSIISRLSLAKTFYWNCGLAKQYFLPLKLRMENLKNYFLIQLPLSLSLALCNFLITGTPAMKRYYHREFGLPESKILVIPNDVDVKEFAGADGSELRGSLGIPDKTPIVLFVHHLSERKGAHKIIPIYETVRKNVPDAVFLVAGDGPERAKLECAAGVTGGGVRVLGPVPNKDIPAFFAAADVLLMPSDEEGMPRVLLESMAAGLPFVASDVGGVLDICGPMQKRQVCDKGDIGCFSEKVSGVLTDRDLASALSAENREQAKKYDTEAVVRIFKNTLM